MTEKIGSGAHPLRVAVIGSGPAGFYAIEALLKQEDVKVEVDLFDRLPTPYGLVRGGVAPDHPKIKSVIKIYERTAGRAGFRFFGNVTFGRDLTLDEMLRHYHQVLFTTGSDNDRHMGIPGEDLPGSFPATIFVGWYNGHPDYTHYTFDLSAERVAVIGIGNVAMDVVRILAQPLAELEKTDITDYALEVLRTSRVKEIYLIGRRGPAQAAFTNPEIRELTKIDGVDLVLRPEDLDLDDLSREFLANCKDPTFKRNVEILTKHLAQGESTQPKKIRARFFESPVEVLGRDRVEGLRLEKNELVKDESGTVRARGTGVFEDLPVDMVFRSVGYKGTALPGVPFEDRWGTIPNEAGRVLDAETNTPLPRLYAAGWIKRGPSGVIGTNKADAIESVNKMLEDAPAVAPGDDFHPEPGAIEELLKSKGVRAVTYADWKKIDAAEVERGAPAGRPRVKFTAIEEMLKVLGE